MYSLIAIFALVPLYFSHVFAPFGVIIGETGSFERQKVYLFSMLVLLALLECIWTRGNLLWSGVKKWWIGLIFLIILPFFPMLISGEQLDIVFFMGSHEKHHGYIFYLGLLLFLVLLQGARPNDISKYIRASLVSGLLVSFFALLEYIGISPFFPGITGTTWGTGRSISTLGNPNYVAGYLLMLLPLAQTIRKPERFVIVALLLMAILSTQSVIAIVLVVLYGVWILGNSVYPSFGTKQREVKNPGASKTETWILRSSGGRGKLAGFFTLVVACSIIAFGYFYIPPDKLLSLTSRFILMGETISIMFQYPLSFLVGYGPDSIIGAYEGIRSPLIDAYFPRGSAIDSSHNIIIDSLFQFGLVFVLILGYFLARSWKKITDQGQEAIFLGIVFLALNPYVLTHMILLILLVSLHDRKNTLH